MYKNGTTYKLNVKPVFSEKEGEIVGIYAGDGSQYFEPKLYKYEVNIHFGLKNYNYARYVKDLYESYFQKKFRLRIESKTKLRMRTYSKELFYYFYNLLNYNRHIKHSTVYLKTLDLPIEFKIGFIRGFFDTDGCLSYNKREKRWKALFCTTSKKLANQISLMLSELDIQNNTTVKSRSHIGEKTVYDVFLYKSSIDRFINLVKPLKSEAGRAGSSTRKYFFEE